MNITIWDLDWYHKTSKLPNHQCMQLSSYHKQKGDMVNFVTSEYHLSLAYDVLYMVRELEKTPMPPRKYIEDNKSKLIGQGFKYYDAKSINSVVRACRPDYLLYEVDTENQYTNANFISFYAGETLITKRQDFHNTKKNRKKTIVVDKCFWKTTDSNIIYCLEELKNEKNVGFSEPISLSKLLNNVEIREKFLELNFGQGTDFKWKNDYSSEVKNIQPIIDFMLQLRQKTKSKLGFIPIKALLRNHTTKAEMEQDFLRCVQIINLFKINQLNCRVIVNKDKSTSWLNRFNELDKWTNKYFKLSYVEFMLHFECADLGMTWDELLNNPSKWRNDKVDFITSILGNDKWQPYIDLFFSQWGYEVTNKNKVSRDFIRKNMNLYYKE